MAMKFWRLRLKGERPADVIQSAVGRSGGNLIRLHFEGGETQVYFTAEKPQALEAAKAMKETAVPEEVSAGEATKLG